MAGVVTVELAEHSWMVRFYTGEGELIDTYEVEKDKLVINSEGLLDLLSKANINMGN